jgi:hypothetical protein
LAVPLSVPLSAPFSEPPADGVVESPDAPSLSAAAVELSLDLVDCSPVGDFGSTLFPVVTSVSELVGFLLGGVASDSSVAVESFVVLAETSASLVPVGVLAAVSVAVSVAVFPAVASVAGRLAIAAMAAVGAAETCCGATASDHLDDLLQGVQGAAGVDDEVAGDRIERATTGIQEPAGHHADPRSGRDTRQRTQIWPVASIEQSVGDGGRGGDDRVRDAP